MWILGWYNIFCKNGLWNERVIHFISVSAGHELVAFRTGLKIIYEIITVRVKLSNDPWIFVPVQGATARTNLEQQIGGVLWLKEVDCAPGRKLRKIARSGKSTVIVSLVSTTQQMCFGACALKRLGERRAGPFFILSVGCCNANIAKSNIAGSSLKPNFLHWSVLQWDTGSCRKQPSVPFFWLHCRATARH